MRIIRTLNTRQIKPMVLIKNAANYLYQLGPLTVYIAWTIANVLSMS